MSEPRRSLLASLGTLIAAPFQRAAPPALATPPWIWPSGNGDRGPLGSWQMNRNAPHRGMELLAFSAVYACVNTIASDISKLPVHVYELDLATGARTLKRSDYYTLLMREPNGYQTAADFMFAFVQSYLLQGNAYVYAGRRNRRGEIAELHVLKPYGVEPKVVKETGEIFYTCGEDWLAGLTENTQTIGERDIIHHRLPLLPGFPLVGVTPIFAAAASSALGLKILADSQQFFANASRPSGVLSSEQHMAPELKERFKQEWDEAYRGGEFGKTAILSGGMKWQPLTITAQDAQLIEQLRYSVEDVARVFRVPPFMLGDMSKVSYRNTEQLGRMYLSNCIGFHLEHIEQRLARAFDFPPNYEIKFDLSGFLRTEMDVRFVAYQQALAAGWISPNEVRAQEGLEPVEGGEEPRVQMQYVPLSQATVPPPVVAPPEPPEPPEDEEEFEDEDDEDDEPPPEPVEQTINPARVRMLLRQRLAA